MGFNNFIDRFRNVGGAQAIVAKVNFNKELLNFEHSGKALPNRTRLSVVNTLVNELNFMIMKISNLKLLVLTMAF